jgi:oxygen-dependent protoporphyrinogen oxidase
MQTTDALVIGAGLSGLTAAYRLHQAKRQVVVLEAAAHVGGLIQTHCEAGFTYEAGPHTFPSTAGAILALCRELNLQPEPAQAAHKRYLYLHRQLTALPQKPWEIFTTPVLSPAGKLRLLQEPFISKTSTDDISVADFLTHRLGAELVAHLADPFISGIYAGDVKHLSLPAVFPQLWAWEQASGSLLRALPANKKPKQKRAKLQLLSFPGGLQTLTEALRQALPPHAVRARQKVTRLEKNESGYTVHLNSGETWRAAGVILTTPAFVSADLLKDLAPAASRALAEIPYNGLAVVHTGFHKEAIPHPLDGFGFLVPRKEKLPLLGSIWASSLFPDRAPGGKVLLSNFIGGAHHPEIPELPPEQIQQQVLDDLETVFKIAGRLEPLFSKVLRYPKAIPQYTLGHLKRIQAIESALQALPNLSLCGNYLHGVALNQCVQSGLDAVKNIG